MNNLSLLAFSLKSAGYISGSSGAEGGEDSGAGLERTHLLRLKVLVAQSCPTLCDPMHCSLPGSSVHGIFQARVLEWSAIAFSNYVPLMTLNLSVQVPWFPSGCDTLIKTGINQLIH